MECRPSQNNETEITENYMHRDAEEDDQEVKFLSHEELEGYKKIQEEFLTFSKAKPTNKSDLRKSLFNIAANLMRLLAILEDISSPDSIVCGAKAKTNYTCREYKKFSTEYEIISKKKKEQLGPKKENMKSIPRIIIQRIDAGGLSEEPMSLHENDDSRMNDKTSDTTSLQYITLLQQNATQTLVKK
ncbi:hypothetical protein TKK_0005339 [Trichogramma kaykai]